MTACSTFTEAGKGKCSSLSPLPVLAGSKPPLSNELEMVMSSVMQSCKCVRPDVVLSPHGSWMAAGKHTGLPAHICVEILEFKGFGWLNPPPTPLSTHQWVSSSWDSCSGGLPIPLFLEFCLLPCRWEKGYGLDREIDRESLLKIWAMCLLTMCNFSYSSEVHVCASLESTLNYKVWHQMYMGQEDACVHVCACKCVFSFFFFLYETFCLRVCLVES